MFNKEKILEIINQEGFFIDKFILEAFIKNWKIESIYEDENGVEYFDEVTIEKIKNGISQKSQLNCEIHTKDKTDTAENPDPEQVQQSSGENCEEETQEQEIEKDEPAIEPIIEPAVAAVELPPEIQNVSPLQNITVDISNQTISALAESIARKFTADVSTFLKTANLNENAEDIEQTRKDNELLLDKVEEMLADNKILIKRIKELEKIQASYVKLFGNVYIRNI
jgi:hypothetical protein